MPRSFPVILPHELIPWPLDGLSKKDLHEMIGAPTNVLEFWDHVEATGMPWHPGLHSRDGLDRVIPVGLHGDDFRFTAGGQKLTAVSLNFILGERRGRYVLFVIRQVPCLQHPENLKPKLPNSTCKHTYRMSKYSEALSTGFETLQAFLRPEAWLKLRSRGSMCPFLARTRE